MYFKRHFLQQIFPVNHDERRELWFAGKIGQGNITSLYTDTK